MIKSKETTDPNSCLSRAHPLEMLFVLLGRDAAAPAAISAWIDERIKLGLNTVGDEQIREAEAALLRFRAQTGTFHGKQCEVAKQRLALNDRVYFTRGFPITTFDRDGAAVSISKPYVGVIMELKRGKFPQVLIRHDCGGPEVLGIPLATIKKCGKVMHDPK